MGMHLFARDEDLISDSIKDSKQRISEHAELIVLDEAHHRLGSADLMGPTLYTSCEPSPLCSFMIREYKFSRVVFASRSPFMDGYSRWNILQENGLEQFERFYEGVPEIVPGYMEKCRPGS